FEAVGREHEGTAAASLAMLEAGNLHEKLGAPHLAQEDWKAGLESAEPGSNLQALMLQRVARAREDAGEWVAAADAYERAGRIERFPEHWNALADAARCRLEAGDVDAALALLTELEAGEAVDRIPAYTLARLREARAARELAAQG
ncbi:MAG TPA: tetratricopeptide repeat protein, partial [Myxococcota bacterium]|nr:tetratricopeptide repeat protein [Myxococcota bacterium]